MRKRTAALALALLLLSACGGEGARDGEGSPPAGASTQPPAPSGEAGPAGAEEIRLSCRLVDGSGTGELVLAQLDYALEGESLHDGRGCGLLALTDEAAVYLDGQPAGPEDLEDGMPVELVCRGVEAADSGPLTQRYMEPVSLSAFSLGSRQNPGGSAYDLCGLYLQVLDDLWTVDGGMNAGISIAGLDLSRAPGGLLDSERAALAYCFGRDHGVEVVEGTFDQLREEGYFTQLDLPGQEAGTGELYHWAEGCLFSIEPEAPTGIPEVHSLPVVRFTARKWRAPLAAYCLADCFAVWPEFGAWSGYTVGHELIA